MIENGETGRRSPSFYEYRGPYRGIFGWIFSTDHKRIGLLYLITILPLFFAAVGLGFTMRLSMFAPGSIPTPQTSNTLFTRQGPNSIRKKDPSPVTAPIGA
jgi:cytochrome c oxidase subunit 1